MGIARTRAGSLPFAGLLIGLLVLLAAGCGKPLRSDPAAPADDVAKDQIKLTIWHNWVGQDGKAIAMRGILNEFRDAHPDVRLTDEGMPTDSFKSRIRTAAAADELPDLFVLFPGTMTKELVAADLIQPIDDFLDGRPDWRNGFPPDKLDGYRVNDLVYAVPMNLAPTSLIYYNRDIFDRYGVKPPSTWEEWMEAIRTFKQAGVIPIALGNKANWLVQSTLFSTLADRITGSDWFMSAVRQDGAKFTDPVFLDALEQLRLLGLAEPFQEGYRGIDENQMAQIYFDGKAAMFINGGWATSNIVQNAPPEVLDHTHIMIIPPIEGGRGDPQAISGVVGTGLGVNKQLEGDRLQAALELFYALAGPEGQKATLDSSTLVSFRIEPDPDKAHPLFLELYELMQRTKLSPVYDAELSAEATLAVNEGLQELLLGGDPSAIAERIQEAQAAAVAQGLP
ncbi:extracellular solute-binding protein [Cohnella cellulosilytica]|uniref:Extracellular solute-binding protein n=1 Tax=Cohnella cellulosilytica TaxID=986710 RepID=A0ABW2FFC7_9BACL